MAMRGYGPVVNMKRRFVITTTVIMTLALGNARLFPVSFLSLCSSRASSIYNQRSNDWRYLWQLYHTQCRWSLLSGCFSVGLPRDRLLPLEGLFCGSIAQYKSLLVLILTFQVANVLSTVTWNYTDLFIILISSSLAARFAQINTRLLNNKVMYEKFWKEIREDYSKLAHLTQVVDKHLAALVAISFVSNAFFICVQLYNSLK